MFFTYNFNTNFCRKGLQNGSFEMPMGPDKPLQMLAVEDFAEFVAVAFNNPDEYTCKEMDIAGDELTMPEAAEVFGRVIGRPVRFVEMPIDRIRAKSEDMAKMYEWFNRVGFDIDIEALKKIHPGMLTLEAWLRTTGWEDIAATYERKAA